MKKTWNTNKIPEAGDKVTSCLEIKYQSPKKEEKGRNKK